MVKDKQGLEGHEAGQERGDLSKGLSPVSNSNQRDHTVLSSLFRPFVPLVFHCVACGHSVTSGSRG